MHFVRVCVLFYDVRRVCHGLHSFALRGPNTENYGGHAR